jgi:integrase
MPDGRRVERAAPWHDNTRERAKELLAALLEERDAELVPTRRLTLAAYLRAWLAEMNVRPATMRGRRWAVESWIIPAIGDVLLSRLGPSAIARMLEGIERPSTRAHVYGTLREALNRAVVRRLLIRSPMAGVEPVLAPAHQATVLSVEQARALIEGTAGDWYGPLWTVLLATGLRISEALGLTWDDFDGKSIAVTGQHQFRDGAWVLVPTKADRTLERIALPAFASAALAAHKVRMAEARQPGWTHFGHIFVTPAGAPPHKVGAELDAACERLKLPRITPHELRHASLTILADAGVPEDVRERRAGHATATMARKYTSQAELADVAAAEVMQRAIGGPK